VVVETQADSHRVFLSTLPAGRPERRLALAAVVMSVAILFASVPFAKVPLDDILGKPER